MGRVRVDRASFEALVADPAACGLDRIEAAIERADTHDAVARAFARLSLGQELPVDFVVLLLPQIAGPVLSLGLVTRAAGDRPAALAALLEGERFVRNESGSEGRAHALYALWQLGDREMIRPVMRRELRRTLRLPLSVPTLAILLWLAEQVAAPDVDQLIADFELKLERSLRDGLVSVAAQAFEAGPVDELVRRWPERATEPAVPCVTIRAVPRPGRNDLCACGSGKKYKRCCADKPEAEQPLGRGPSRAELLALAAPRLQPHHLGELEASDLAQLEVQRLQPETLIEYFRQQMTVNDWRRAALAVDEVGRRRGLEVHAVDLREELIHELCTARRHDLAREHLAKVGASRFSSDDALHVALLCDEPDALARLRAAALVAAADATGGAAIDLAHVLLEAAPGLGLAVARGALRAERALDAEMLLEAMEDARDQLLLPPGDPAAEVYAALEGAQRRRATTSVRAAELSRTADELRTRLGETTAQLAELERRDAARAAELERAQRAAAAAAARPGPAQSEPDRRAQRAKLEQLQAQIRESNAERAELRRRLADAAAATARPPATATPTTTRSAAAADTGADDDDDDLGAPAAPAGRGVLVPRFLDRAITALADVPRHVGAAAVRAAGALAAGDDAAWRGVKQAKDMASPVLMARVGIHHRLLVRIADGALEVIDLVPREALLTTLKLLRSR